MSGLDDYHLADVLSSAHSKHASGSPSEELHRVMPKGLSQIEEDLTDRGKEFFALWLNMNGELQSLDNAESFNLGFRLGAKYVYDILMGSGQTNLSEEKQTRSELK